MRSFVGWDEHRHPYVALWCHTAAMKICEAASTLELSTDQRIEYPKRHPYTTLSHA